MVARAPKYVPRLKQRYREVVVPALMKEFGYKNPMAVPRLEKITINMGLGEAIQNPKALDRAVEELSMITGQRPVITRAKKSIAAFKLRKGMAIGAMVTLRGDRMYEFLVRLLHHLGELTLSRHTSLSYAPVRKGIPSSASSARASSSVLAVVVMQMFMPRALSTLLKSTSGKTS